MLAEITDIQIFTRRRVINCDVLKRLPCCQMF